MTIRKYAEMLQRGDVTLYQLVPTQTSVGDRTSLLELQRVVRAKGVCYSYLEVGSFLGGTLTPLCLDSACRSMYSVDSRVLTAPNEGGALESEYGVHTSEAMRQRLFAATGFDVSRLTCFDSDIQEIPTDAISEKVDYALIDGEHTNDAVVRDFLSLERFLATDAVIAFHDYWCVKSGVDQIESHLRSQGRRFLSVKLGGDVFAIFLDPKLARNSVYICEVIKKWRWVKIRQVVKCFLPVFVLMAWRRLAAGKAKKM